MAREFAARYQIWLIVVSFNKRMEQLSPLVVSPLQGRTDQQCMGRWRRHLDPSIKRDSWKAAEDAKLAALYAQYASQWARICKHIRGRTAQQCRARCVQELSGKL